MSQTRRTEGNLSYAQRAQRLVKLARFEPIRYQREILNLTVDPWQEEATEAVFDVVRKRHGLPTKINHAGKNYFTIRAMHGPGKTFWLASLIHTFGIAFPKARIPCIAPKMDQLKTRLWLELRKVADAAGANYKPFVEIQSTTMKFLGVDDWMAFAQTATKAENLAGLHSDFILVAVDEASGVPEHLWPTIFGAVSTGLVPILVMISNPTRNTGTFAESWLRPQVASRFHQVAITLPKAPRVSTDWVQSMAMKYGQNSAIYKIRCLGEFSDSGDEQLIPLQWIIDARAEPDYRPPMASIPRLRVSVDVADGGIDETVITVARHYAECVYVLSQRRFSFPSAESPIMAAKAAVQIFDAWGGDKSSDDIVVDSLGVGAGTAGWLLDNGYSVVTYRGGESSDDPDQWRNRRVQSYINLRNAFRDKTLIFAHDAVPEEDWEDMFAQLCSIEMRNGGNRVEDLATKDEMKRKGIKSPDMADSLAMQYATQYARMSTQLPPREEYLPEMITNDSWSAY